ncbi:MAG: hypothetical protein AB8D78_04220 [Akkermansiaceae bacterium]
MSDRSDWNEDDPTWDLLEKAVPKKASDRFADDVVRAVRTMPEKDSFWSGMVGYAPWVGALACAALAAFLVISQQDVQSGNAPVVEVSPQEEWSEIEDVAEVEILSAAADHLDDFSDEELIAMIGF